MKGLSLNIETAAQGNSDFRHVLYTGKHAQLVLMSLLVAEEIGNEVHENIDQFIRIERGTAKAVLNNGETEYQLSDGAAVFIPAGTWHNIINTGASELKLYTLYSPPGHQDGVIVHTKAEAVEESFDGKTSE